MKTKIHTDLFVIILLIIFISGFAAIPSAKAAELGQEPDPVKPIEKEETSPTIDIITPGDNGIVAPMAPMNTTQLSTDFEAGEGSPPGFSPGYCAQNGWTAFAASTAQGQISTANPYSGSQHLRIAYDPSVPTGSYVGCFSPNAGAQTIGPAWMEVDVAISNAYGANYDVIVQAPSQGFITARVSFDWLGNILILDDPGSGLQWVDTGQTWNVGPYTTLRIEVDPAINTIRYYYGGTLIYTGSVFAGSTIEQIILFSDNYNFLGDVADFDSLQAYSGTYPTSINLVSFQQAQANLPSWIIPVALIALLLPGTVIIRRQFRTDVN